jgi:hypothetical protein
LTDGMHVGMLQYSFKFRNLHKGYKLDLPTPTYNLSRNHHRHILSTAKDHPGWWNDKTLVLFDDFVCDLNGGEILEDVKFELLEKDDQSRHLVARRYRGAWLIVDNGYLKRVATIPPFKIQAHMQNCAGPNGLSLWYGKTLNAVGCVFGIQKDVSEF